VGPVGFELVRTVLACSETSPSAQPCRPEDSRPFVQGYRTGAGQQGSETPSPKPFEGDRTSTAPVLRTCFTQLLDKVFRRMYMPTIVPFRFESELREPITTWLQDAGFDVQLEVPILSHRADLVGSRGTTVTAVEMKLHQWARALRQAIAYQLAADHVWVAMPLAEASRAYRQRWTFEAEGVGLLAVDDEERVRSPILAGMSPRLLPFLRERVLENLRVYRMPLESSSGASVPPALSHTPPASLVILPGR